jgi:hypothetical protein
MLMKLFILCLKTFFLRAVLHQDYVEEVNCFEPLFKIS